MANKQPPNFSPAPRPGDNFTPAPIFVPAPQPPSNAPNFSPAPNFTPLPKGTGTNNPTNAGGGGGQNFTPVQNFTPIGASPVSAAPTPAAEEQTPKPMAPRPAISGAMNELPNNSVKVATKEGKVYETFTPAGKEVGKDTYVIFPSDDYDKLFSTVRISKTGGDSYSVTRFSGFEGRQLESRTLSGKDLGAEFGGGVLTELNPQRTSQKLDIKAGDVMLSSRFSGYGSNAPGFLNQPLPPASVGRAVQPTGFDKTFADAFQARKEAELNLFKVGAGQNEANAFATTGFVLAGARFGQNIINLPGSVAALVTDPVGTVKSIPASLKESTSEPGLFVGDLGFAYVSGKVGSKVGGEAFKILDEKTANFKVSYSVTRAENAALIQEGGRFSSTDAGYGVVRVTRESLGGLRKVNTDFQVDFGSQSAITPINEGVSSVSSVSVAKVSGQGIKAGENGILSSSGGVIIKGTPVGSDFSAMLYGKAVRSGGGGTSQFAGKFITRSLGQTQEAELFMSRGVSVSGDVGSASIKNVNIQNTVYRGAKLELPEPSSSGGDFMFDSVTKTKVAPRNQLAAIQGELLSPVVKDIAFKAVKDTAPSAELTLRNPISSMNSAYSVELYDKRYGASGISALDTGIFSENVALSGASGRASMSINQFLGSDLSVISPARQDNLQFLRGGTDLFVNTRPSAKINVGTDLLLNIDQRQNERLSFKQPQILGTRSTGRGAFGGLPFGVNAPASLVNLGGIDGRERRNNGRKSVRTPNQKLIFTPSLVAEEFGISGDVNTKGLFTGSEFRPLPRRRRK